MPINSDIRRGRYLGERLDDHWLRRSCAQSLGNFQIIVLLWCSVDGRWCISVGFRLWRPKRSCAPPHYRTRFELGLELVTAVVVAKLPVCYRVGDTHYTAGWFTKKLTRLGLTWHGALDPKTTAVWQGKRPAVRDLATALKLKWRSHLGLHARALTVFSEQ